MTSNDIPYRNSTCAEDGACLLDGLGQHTQSIMEGALGLVQNLLGCTAQHNCACLTQCNTTELDQLRARNKRSDN